MKILVPNLGSTSLKYQLIDMPGEQVLARGKMERIGSPDSRITHWDPRMGKTELVRPLANHREAVELLTELLGVGEGSKTDNEIAAVGFKTIHGGPRFCGSFRVNEELLEAMREFLPPAPVHNAVYLEALGIFREVLPSTPLVGVFETGFHRTMPEKAYLYGVPYVWYEKHGIRRYGFHGASHRYISQQVPKMLENKSAAGLRLVSCHLGGSSSICAVQDGKSIDTSMGFSAQAGIEHATRCGDLDAFVIPFVMKREGLTVEQACRQVTHQGGLTGISGVGSDLRDLEEAAAKGNRRAAAAMDVMIYQVKKYIGAYAAAMGGLDALAFAGGIGENAGRVRREICRDLDFLGVRLDEEKNRASGSGDRNLSRPDSPVAVVVIYTNEEIVVARETIRVLGESEKTAAF